MKTLIATILMTLALATTAQALPTQNGINTTTEYQQQGCYYDANGVYWCY